MTVLFTDPIFLNHDTGEHPETAHRLRAISSMLDESGLRGRCQPGTHQPADPSALRTVHAPRLIERVRQTAEAGGGHLDADTVVSPASYSVALAAGGACMAAVDAVLAGPERTSLCLIRPPGHHATPTHSMGFCLFNNVAVAARHARLKHSVNRVLIVDWDVHHGNGTQDIFYEDPTVYFLSIHRYGQGFYPGTGAADDTGAGAGLGTTRNIPIRYGTSRDACRARFVEGLEKAADAIKPELVFVSAGFDAHRLDPIGNLGLEAEDFAQLTRGVLEVSRTHAGGRLVSCLEGGYNWQATANSVRAHLEELLAG
ncbi:MAG TPA: histone deacetylase [Gemmataceae bacterium]|nr:histone deacetylase [Gemmataceae bacterium]